MVHLSKCSAEANVDDKLSQCLTSCMEAFLSLRPTNYFPWFGNLRPKVEGTLR